MRTLLVVSLAIALWAVGLAMHARAQDFVELPPELDARASDIYRGIMCPVCNGQTISQSNSEVASTMRHEVRERLLAGDTDEEIYDFMADAYGEDILASPPTTGVGLAVWIIPPLAIVAGGVVIALVIRRLKQRQLATSTVYTPGPQARHEVDSYLRMVDEELGEKT